MGKKSIIKRRNRLCYIVIVNMFLSFLSVNIVYHNHVNVKPLCKKMVLYSTKTGSWLVIIHRETTLGAI